jgi:hypothetical protein
MLEKEFKYFEKNKQKFIAEHPNEYVVIAGEKVFGFFKNEETAIKEALKHYKAGEFLCQKCSESSDQIMRFHSRVVMA